VRGAVLVIGRGSGWMFSEERQQPVAEAMFDFWPCAS